MLCDAIKSVNQILLVNADSQWLFQKTLTQYIHVVLCSYGSGLFGGFILFKALSYVHDNYSQ